MTEADLARPTASPSGQGPDQVRGGPGAPSSSTTARRWSARCKGAARLAIAGYVAGGRATLKAIEAGRYDVLRRTPRPGKADTLAMMASCYVKGR